MRILCLHGGHHSADTFHQQFGVPFASCIASASATDDGDNNNGSLMRIRLDFVDGPLMIPEGGDSEQERRRERGPDRPIARRWFNEDTPRENIRRYDRPVGFDASVQHVLQIWRTGKGARKFSSFTLGGVQEGGERYDNEENLPFDGILGFGQGAALTSWMEREGLCCGLRFVILVGGYEIDLDNEGNKGNIRTVDGTGEHSLFDNENKGRRKETFVTKGEVPSLHIIGRQNPLIPPGESIALARTFPSAVVHVFPGGHCIPPITFSSIKTFLLSQHLCNRRSLEWEKEVVRQRRALVELERKASELVMEHSSKNPPKALLAVIGSGRVGGWLGPRRRSPGEEGGGAPCPEDFLCRREERNGVRDVL